MLIPCGLNSWLMMIHYQLSAVSYQLLSISYCLSAIVYQLSAIVYQCGKQWSSMVWVWQLEQLFSAWIMGTTGKTALRCGALICLDKCPEHNCKELQEVPELLWWWRKDKWNKIDKWILCDGDRTVRKTWDRNMGKEVAEYCSTCT